MVCYYLNNWGVPRRKPGPIRKIHDPKAQFWRLDIKRRYGVTEDQYNALFETQDGVCAICLKKCAARARLGVDHCHTTKKVRGLLCVKCNNAIGLFNDDPQLARRASEYLSK